VDVLVHEDVGALMAGGGGEDRVSEPYVIEDMELKYLILGALRVMPSMDAFPLMVREVIDNFGADGIIQSFTIVTASGLRFTVRVDYEGSGGSEDGGGG
jgi:hypothetical protein